MFWRITHNNAIMNSQLLECEYLLKIAHSCPSAQEVRQHRERALAHTQFRVSNNGQIRIWFWKGNVILKPESTRGRAQLISLFYHHASTAVVNRNTDFMNVEIHAFCTRIWRFAFKIFQYNRLLISTSWPLISKLYGSNGIFGRTKEDVNENDSARKLYENTARHFTL